VKRGREGVCEGWEREGVWECVSESERESMAMAFW
jgi:hypothetical protein